ncbi:MAG: 3'(2'),5'-bisphosphate nucleotidase CysQ, partial [Myxococcota bacterium]|nr:3'(2'),5'-bisphosphate nucleotidase CysQ [Myxococcota bacterium]
MYEREEAFAARAARLGGEAVMRWYAAGVRVDWKGRGDPVTEADREADALIVEAIRREFPGDAVLSEESADDAGRLGRERLWLVDPLDGTREFIDRVGEFVVMVALAHRGSPVAGAIFHPVSGRLYRARLGAGAWVEDSGSARRLAVSAVADPAAARLVVSRSHRSARIDEARRILGIEQEEPCGSVGLKVARLAEGRADLYIHAGGGTREWDLAAPEIVLREAGGLVTDAFGRPLE